MRTGAGLLDRDGYHMSTIMGIKRYVETFEEPFIKGLLKDKGENNFLFIENKKKEVLVLMDELVDDFKNQFSGVPIYLYTKHDRRKDRGIASVSLVWRVRRKVRGSGENIMISNLFSPDGKQDYLINQFGPVMRSRLNEYEECRMLLNMAESILRTQIRLIKNFYQSAQLCEKQV